MIEATHRYGRYPAGSDRRDPRTARRRACGARAGGGGAVADGERFTPNSQYGVCPGLRHAGGGVRAAERRACAAATATRVEGWDLVHTGPDAGWHQKVDELRHGCSRIGPIARIVQGWRVLRRPSRDIRSIRAIRDQFSALHRRSALNSRERVVTALNHQEPDRVPIDFGCAAHVHSP